MRFAQFKRTGDEGEIRIRVDQISMIVDNADENGIVAGTTAIYLKSGFAVAVLGTPAQAEAVLHAAEVVQ